MVMIGRAVAVSKAFQLGGFYGLKTVSTRLHLCLPRFVLGIAQDTLPRASIAYLKLGKNKLFLIYTPHKNFFKIIL